MIARGHRHARRRVVYFGWVRTWSSVYVPSTYPPFADMRVILGAVRSVKHGYDPRIANVGEG